MVDVMFSTLLDTENQDLRSSWLDDDECMRGSVFDCSSGRCFENQGSNNDFFSELSSSNNNEFWNSLSNNTTVSTETEPQMEIVEKRSVRKKRRKQQEENTDRNDVTSFTTAPHVRDLHTPPIVYVPRKQVRPKQEPVSKKAAQVYKQRELKSKFDKQIPILTSRPFLKDVEHALFCCLPNLVLLWMFKILTQCSTQRISTCSLTEFLQLYSKPMASSAPASAGRNRTKQMSNSEKDSLCVRNATAWYFQMLALDKEQNTIVSVYYHGSLKLCYVIVFDDEEGKKQEPLANGKGDEQIMIFVRHVLNLQKSDAVSMFISHFPLLNGIACCKYFPTFQPPMACKQKLWHGIALAMMLSHYEGGEDSTTTTNTMTHGMVSPEVAMQGVIIHANKEEEATTSALLYLFAQSLLYNALDNQRDIESALRAHFPRQTKQTQALFDVLQRQRCTKPSTPSKRLCNNRIGKFKGRQNEQIFCLVINNEIGFHADLQQLTTSSLLQLLIQASQQPNESEFDFADVREKLPMVFGSSDNGGMDGMQTRLFSGFQITSPCMHSRDPTVCFAPVMHMLWPNIENAPHLAALNGKKWKVEFEIRALAATEDCVTMEQFLKATNFTPATLLTSSLSDWVSVVDGNQQPYGIYYLDPACTLCNATQWLNRLPDMTVTEYQKPSVVCAGKFGSIRKMQFIRDPFHKIWFGSRQHGIVIRRYYRNGQVHMRTFRSNEELLSHKANFDSHAFLCSLYAIHEKCALAPNVSVQALDFTALLMRLQHEPTDSRLIIVEDLGPIRTFVLGHESRVSWYECTLCPVAQNNTQWANYLTRDTVARPFVMPSCSFLTSSLLYGSPLSIRQEDCPVQALLPTIEAHMKRDTHTNVTVSAMRHPKIRYLPSFAEVQRIVYEHYFHYAAKCGVTALQMHSLHSFTAKVPSGCTCCRTPDICFVALSSVIGFIQSRKQVRSISTNCKDIQGKWLQLEPTHFDIGIRCKHDWTNGLDIGFNLVVEPHPTPDVFICRKNFTAGVPSCASSMMTTVLMLY